MKAFFFVAVLILCISCSNTNDYSILEPKQQDNLQLVSSVSISETEQICKENLAAFAEAFSTTLLTNDDVVKLIDSRIKIRRGEYLPDRVFIADLLQENNDTLNSFFIELKSVFKDNGHDWDLLLSIFQNENISIFCPIPLEDYSDFIIPTIVSEPIDNLCVGLGYEFKGDCFVSVPVDYDYLDKLPVWIIQRDEYKDYSFAVYPDDSNDSMTEIDDSSFEKDSTYLVKIDEIFVKERFGLYENKYEFAFIKGQQSSIINPTDFTASAGFDNLLMAYVRPKNIRKARKGLEEGWVKINLVFDQAWKPNEIEQVLAIYEVDPYKSFTISGTVKYTLDVAVGIGDVKIDAGREITVSCQTVCQTSLNNFVGCMQFDRMSFLGYMMSNNQDNYFNNSYLRNGNVIQSMNQNFYFTCTKQIVY
ncbi:MAG: hypothetical protein ACI3ZZ_02115 [Candidatus Aphodosoma sp.]